MSTDLKFKRKIGAKNASLIISLPKELTEWLQLHPKKEIILEPKNGKFGKYIVMYVEENNKNKEKLKKLDVILLEEVENNENSTTINAI